MNADEGSLLQLLKTGSLGKLEPGMSVDDVLDFVGIPQRYPSLNELHAQQPELWQEAASNDKVFHGLDYGCLFPMFHGGKLQFFIVGIERFPERQLPAPLSNDWLADLSQMTSDEFRAFVQEQNLPNLRFNNVRLPPAWVSTDPVLEVHLEFSTPSRIKRIQSGSPWNE